MSVYIPRSGIALSYDNSMFSFLRNVHTIFLNGYTNLHSHQEGSWFSLHPFQQICRFLKMANQTSMRWNFIVVWICTSLIMRDMEHLFMFLLVTICMSSLEKCLFRSSAHFLIVLFFGYRVVWVVCTFWK